MAKVSRAIAADRTLAARYTWAHPSGGRGQRRQCGARTGRYRSVGLAAGDGGQVGAVQDLRRAGLDPDRRGTPRIPRSSTSGETAPTFGAVNLEDISAPRCFEIERRVIEALDCPVMHDDQHGTAIVVLAALLGATAVLERKMSSLKMVISGAGAAGVACANILCRPV